MVHGKKKKVFEICLSVEPIGDRWKLVDETTDGHHQKILEDQIANEHRKSLVVCVSTIAAV